jgi:membrane-bound lytic murein transglycosylase MltF
MKLRVFLLFLSMVVPASQIGGQSSEDPAETDTDQLSEAAAAVLDRPLTSRTGDLDEMRKARIIRVLVTYNRTNFFVLGGRIRGYEYELLQGYEKHLNKGRPRKEIRTTMVFIPVTRDQLIPFLVDGKGDIAAASLTITPEREAQAGFTDPYHANVEEIIVTHESVKDVSNLGDLAGRRVYVAKSTSYAEHLRTHNEVLGALDRPPIEIVEVEEHLETEDILELVNSGVIEVTVVDKHLATLWAGVLEDIVPREDIVVNSGGQLAWAVRKTNPDLLADLNKYVEKNRDGTYLGNVLFKRYYRGTKWVKNPLAELSQGWRDYLFPLFRRYGEQYDIDWVAIAALAYQESGWDQELKSPVGAVGVMQVLPTTALDMGVSDPYEVEGNIKAGVRYLDWMRKRYFDDPDLDPAVRADLLIASYNAGPNKIVRMRGKAEEMGLDPDKWFYNVERAARRYIGRETVQYVANVNKYYFSFKLMLEKHQKREAEREALRDN